MTRTTRPPTGTVLLTGSEGAIGTHLGPALRDAGYAVRSLDLRPGGGTDHRVADMLDLAAVREAMQGVSAVVHAGGIPWDLGDGSAVISANVLGTWNVLQAAVDAGAARVIAFSSINAQGSVRNERAPAYFPIDDDYPPHPLTPYQLSKHLMEETCRSFSERHGLITLCLRPVFVLHPASRHADGFGSEGFVETWREDYWAYVDVRDIQAAVLRSLQVEGPVHDRFLLAASDTSVAEETRALVEREFPDVPWPAVQPDRYFADDPHRSLVDCRHAHDVLGWAPRYSWRHRPTPTPSAEG